MLTKEDKSKLIKSFAISDKDVGSAAVQVALLTKNISKISEHLKLFPKDNHSKLGLLKMIGKRKRFLNYLRNKDVGQYSKVKKELEI